MNQALYALQILQQIPALIAAGQSVLGLVQDGSAALEKMVSENRDPTEAEWDALNAVTKALRDQLHS